MYHCLDTALFIAAFAWLWIAVLIQPGKLFEWVPPIVERVIRSEYWQQPFIYCEKCLAGQIALWYGLHLFLMGQITYVEHFALIVWSIVLAAFIGAAYNWLNKTH